MLYNRATFMSDLLPFSRSEHYHVVSRREAPGLFCRRRCRWNALPVLAASPLCTLQSVPRPLHMKCANPHDTSVLTGQSESQPPTSHSSCIRSSRSPRPLASLSPLSLLNSHSCELHGADKTILPTPSPRSRNHCHNSRSRVPRLFLPSPESKRCKRSQFHRTQRPGKVRNPIPIPYSYS
jgi:hypothetical protein